MRLYLRSGRVLLLAYSLGIILVYLILYMEMERSRPTEAIIQNRYEESYRHNSSIKSTTRGRIRAVVVCHQATQCSDNVNTLLAYLRSLRLSVAPSVISQTTLLGLDDHKARLFDLLILESFFLYEQVKLDQLLARRLKDKRLLVLKTDIYDSVDEAQVIQCRLNPVADFYTVTKFSKDLLPCHLNGTSSLVPLESHNSVLTCGEDSNLNLITAHENNGTRTVLIGVDLDILVAQLVLDALLYLCRDEAVFHIERYIQIDIDDIFVGSSGEKLKPHDVQTLIQLQSNLSSTFLTDFKFNLGFSGFYYQASTNLDENKADQLLINERHRFNWFDHTWRHLQPHSLNRTLLQEQVSLNQQFAQRHNLPVDSTYSVTPHHSGIYPVYEPLYDHWSQNKIRATSTELYPSHRPVYTRRGFNHKNIMVMPRFSCNVFTHTIYFDQDQHASSKSISPSQLRHNLLFGQDSVLKSILLNPVAVIMTHMTNYANDQLAVYALDFVFDHLKQWTNLKFKSLSPIQTAQKYFEINPSDRSDVVWTNYCENKKHLAIWSLNSSYCDRMPSLVIIGPQKTGTTALYTFLKEHPLLKSNKMSNESFEETQFFSDRFYHRGIDWYLSQFERPDQNQTVVFEKSANYFAEPLAPLRIKTMLNKTVRLIFLSINPIDRAYSWYQHMRAHNDRVAMRFSFFDIIKLNNASIDQNWLASVKQLRKKCLDSGKYGRHLKNWLKYFSPSQIFSLDGDELKKTPNITMLKVQKFLQLPTLIDYVDILRYDVKKRFYCIVKTSASQNETKKVCLGSGKGRKYKRIDKNSRAYLKKYYKRFNIEFKQLLIGYGLDVPEWLKKQV